MLVAAVGLLAGAALASASPADAGPLGPMELGAALRAHALRGLRPSVVAQILTAEEGGEIGIAVLAVPGLGTGEADETLLFVEIDGADLLATNHAPVPRLEVYAYALDSAGRTAGHLARAFALDVGSLGEAVWQSGLKLYGLLSLPPGEFRLRVLVRNAHSGATGLRQISLEVPEAGGGRAVLLSPLFVQPESRDLWLPVDGWSRPGISAEPRYPFVTGSLAVDPAALPVLVAGIPKRVFLFGYNLPSGALTAEVTSSDAQGELERPVAPRAVEIESRGTVAGTDLEYLVTRFTPPEVERGHYRVRFSFGAGTASESSSPAVPVLLIRGGTRELGLLWCDLRDLFSGAGRLSVSSPAPGRIESGTETAERERMGRAARRVARDYRAVLARLDAGRPEATRNALFELESSVLGTAGEGRLKRLRGAELATARELSRGSAEVLLPVLMLHADAYQLYRGRRLFSLSFHARAMVELLAELYAELGGSPATTARVMASLAGYLQRANLLASSRRLYLRGLEHDPGSPAALLGIATSFEKYGGYGDAIVYLERLAKAAPDLEEGLLRLAVNLTRVGRRERARELFEKVIARNTGSWACAVAYQELARDYLYAAAPERAAALLTGAIEQMPELQGHRILLAHVFARLGQPQRALQHLQAVAPRSASEGLSERLVYDGWSPAILDEARRELAAAAAAASSELTRALKGDSAASGG